MRDGSMFTVQGWGASLISMLIARAADTDVTLHPAAAPRPLRLDAKSM